jgi:hypothetical protein
MVDRSLAFVDRFTRRPRTKLHLNEQEVAIAARPGGHIQGAAPCIIRRLPLRFLPRVSLLVTIGGVLTASAPFLGGQALFAGAALATPSVLPDAPEPDSPEPLGAMQTPASSPTAKPNPCPRTAAENATPGNATPSNATQVAGHSPTKEDSEVHPADVPCTTRPLNWYQRFTNGPKDKPLTPRDKAWLATRNLVDPFNLLTIVGEAGISVAADSHSPYGPGMPGFARYSGVSFTQDMTGEFFGTFLIPSIAHQDPHYHRMEGRSIPRRTFHAIAQVIWTDGDNGRGMPNYANLVGFAIDDEVSNLYVPGRETNMRASAERYGIGFATAPLGNFVNEFLPDVASRIHVQVVVIQRIINQVAKSETAGSTAQ